MEIIQKTTFLDIERFMESLGPYDREDTNRVLTQYPYFYLIKLSESDFFSCIFLSNNSTRIITPIKESRKLEMVAKRAIQLLNSSNSFLGPNWDINQIYQNAMQIFIQDHKTIQPLVLRDTKHNEQEQGAFKYIHDGCHRSLGYAMLLINKKLTYSPINAYLATQEAL